jgi:hypothetical protein
MSPFTWGLLIGGIAVALIYGAYVAGMEKGAKDALEAIHGYLKHVEGHGGDDARD